MSTLSERLRAARRAIHPPLRQKDVAERLGQDPSTVSLWEKGVNEPKAETLRQLAEWYRVSTDWLLDVPGSTAPGPIARDAVAMPRVHTVPVVTAQALSRWSWDVPEELLQTIGEYPARTAAAVLVTTDALQSTCPSGAYAVISKAHAPEPGRIVLASRGRASEPFLRRLLSDGEDMLLVADDQRYPTFRAADGVHLIGTVTEVCMRHLLV